MAELQRYQMLIDGQWVDAEGGKTFESVNPATEAPWALIPEAGATDVERAVEAAHRAFTEGPWPKMTPTERGKLLRRLADLLAERSEDLGRAETVDTGKLLKETRGQAKYLAVFVHYFDIYPKDLLTAGSQTARHCLAAFHHATPEVGYREKRG